MKKLLITLFLLLMAPISVLGYSEDIILGGDNIGIEIHTDGILVVGYYKIDNEFINKNNIKIGDIIYKIGGEKVDNTNFSSLINKYIKNNKVNITIKRGNKEKEVKLNLIKENNEYKTGLYVKTSLVGIGTLTYIDPITHVYGALGHEIAESNSGTIISVLEGKIYKSEVNSIRKSTDGNPGSKSAKIEYNKSIGDILSNTTSGIFGKYSKEIIGKKYKVSSFDEIEKGKAYIYTVLNGKEIKEYEIEITSLNKSKIRSAKSISFIITDSELLNKTGGIIQGMSGSPIVQNNKIIGAVTNVVVDDVTRGYAIFIRTMLEEGDLILEN